MFEKFADTVSNVLVVAAGIAIILMMLHIVADITGKTIFNAPVEGTIEIVESYYMVMVVALPFAYVARGEGHIIVELFTRGLSPRNIAGLDAMVGIVTFLFMCLLAWNAGEDAIAKTILQEVRESGDSTIISWPTRWLMPVGSGAMAIIVLMRVIADTKIFLRKMN